MITITHIDENAGTAFAWEAVDTRFPTAHGWGSTPNQALDDLTELGYLWSLGKPGIPTNRKQGVES